MHIFFVLAENAVQDCCRGGTPWRNGAWANGRNSLPETGLACHPVLCWL